LSKGSAFAELIHLSMPECEVGSLLSSVDVQSYEFRETINSFLQSSIIRYTPHKTLDSIARSKQCMHEAMSPSFFQTLQPEVFSSSSPEYRLRLEKILTLKETVKQYYEKFQLDALAYPHQRCLVVKVGPMSQPKRNGILAALTGRPAICIPGRYSHSLKSTSSLVHQP
jgi:hypothetical protein